MPLFFPSASAAAASTPSTEIQFIGSSARSDVFANGVEYTPLRIGLSDTIEFQTRADSAGTLALKIGYVMSAANGGNIRLRFDRLTIAIGGSPSAALTTGTAFSVTPGNDTTMHAITSSNSSDLAFVVTAGDVVRILITRIADANDTHTGDVRALAIAGTIS